ncbi:DUF397 domain-containing protein [Streptomyces xantholiticus]
MRRASTEVPDSLWFKSSYSGGNETECLEMAFTTDGTAVRDSKRPHARLLIVHRAAWEDFICVVRNGQLG